MNYEKLPKVELHLHLDCSLSYSLVSQLLPGISAAEYREKFVAPSCCSDLSTYLSKALRAIELLQTKENLHLAVVDLFDQLKRDQVVYAEIRFAPLEHTKAGLTAHEVVQTVENSIALAQKQFGIMARLILCTLRHYSRAQSDEVADLCIAYKGSNVVALDIAGDEKVFGLNNHISAFEKVQKEGICSTAHAGEACGCESVEETLNLLRPNRIGHGVRSVESPATLERLRNQEIHLEVCPTSNHLTGIYPNYRQHPIDELMKSGISLGINTDGRTISNVSLEHEYRKLSLNHNWGEKEFLQANREAIQHAFIPESIKFELIKRWFNIDSV